MMRTASLTSMLLSHERGEEKPCGFCRQPTRKVWKPRALPNTGDGFWLTAACSPPGCAEETRRAEEEGRKKGGRW